MTYVSPWSRVRDLSTEISFCTSQLKDYPENDLFVEGDGGTD